MKPISRRKDRKRTPWLPAGLLVFDTETTTDQRQQLTFGFWRYHRLTIADAGLVLACVDEGIVYADELPEADSDGFHTLDDYRRGRRPETDPFTIDVSTELRFLPRTEFIGRVLVPVMEDSEAAVCGFNLAYDGSRVALVAERAQRHRKDRSDMFEGGFSFGLESYTDPRGELRADSPFFGRLRIRSLDSKKHLFEWTRDRVFHNGHFLDARMLAFGFSAEAGSLEGCCERFGVIDPTQLETELAQAGFRPSDLYRQLALRSGRELGSRLLTGDSLTSVEHTLAIENGHELLELLDRFDKPFRKRPAGHGTITPEYVEYARDDVWATAELCLALLNEHQALGIVLQPTKVFSPASIAKDLYDRLRIRPLLERYPKLDKQTLGWAMAAFYGGRAECRIRKQLLPCMVVDATSMYPAGGVRMGLHCFDSRQVAIRELHGAETKPLQELLDGLSVERLLDRSIHPELVFFAEIDPQPGDVLPVRAPYGGEGEHGIGVNELEHSIEPLWYAGPDLAGSVVLAGRAPRIRRALTFEFGRRLPGLRPVELPDGTLLDPRRDDPSRLLIETRKRLEARADLPAEQRQRADRFLKVVASSLYGISAEMNRQQLQEQAAVEVYGLSQFETDLKTPEIPGAFFNPFRAALTTAWARMLLAMLERLITDAGGSYLACDTDSMLIVSSRERALFPCPGGAHGLLDGREAVLALSWDELDLLLRRFHPLRAFDTELVPDFWRIEKINHEGNDPAQPLRQLWCLAISAKRYALYTGDDRDRLRPIAAADGTDDDAAAELIPLEPGHEVAREGRELELVDRREHGLGHLLNPLDPAPDSRAWISEAWTYLERRARGETQTAPAWFALPAMTRTTLSTPDLRRPFEAFNKGKPYREQIKPFNFLMRPQADHRYKPAGKQLPSLITAYNEDSRTWLTATYLELNSADGTEWQITTGTVDPDDRHRVKVKTYGQVIADYWDHVEAKSLAPDGTPCNAATVGLLRRRRVRLALLQHIGKEGNKVEQREHGLVTAQADYLNLYDDPPRSPWALYVTKAMPAFTTAEITQAMRHGPGPVLAPGVRETLDRDGRPISASSQLPTGRTIRNARLRSPDPENERLITAAIVRLAAERLEQECISAPRTAPGSPYLDELACLSLFVEDPGRCLPNCALPGCNEPTRTRSPYCCEAHKRRASRSR
jgi:hypothetical protein